MMFCRAFTLVFVVVSFSQQVCCEAPLHVKVENYRVPGNYIVVLKDSADVESFTTEFRASVLRGAATGKIKHTYKSVINGFSAQLSEDTLQKLRKSEQVKYIEEDGIMRTSVSSWGLARVDQRDLDLASDDLDFFGDGSGTHVYILDTGTLYSHDEFNGRTGDGYDSTASPITVGLDCNGHGTHCGGTAAGTTYGIATDATVHSVRVFGCDGGGLMSDLIDGMDWVRENAPALSVVSISLGGDVSQSTNDAVDALYDAGIVSSVAAGNDNIDACGVSPASASNAITVGATDNTDARASFSNYGSCLDIFAPGVSIVSATNTSSSSTGTWSGTSMACPHVTGAAAALLSKNNYLSPGEITDLLIKGSTVDDVTDTQGSVNRLLYIGKATCMLRCNTAQDTSYSCQCDSGCSGRGDCCTDVAALCDVQTCSGRCGSAANAPCACDYQCADNGNCCSDYTTECANSCKNRCDVDETANYPCQCDDTCTDDGNCCSDYTDLCVPPACNEDITTAGTLTSPNYPSNYDNDLNCEISITGPSGKQVLFAISNTNFRVDSSAGCTEDSLSIYSASSANANALMGSFCGIYSSLWAKSGGNNMFLVFVTNEADTSTGYTADITFVEPTMKSILKAGTVMAERAPDMQFADAR